MKAHSKQGPQHSRPRTAAEVAVHQMYGLERERDTLRMSVRALEQELAKQKTRSAAARKIKPRLEALKERVDETAVECGRLRGRINALTADNNRLTETLAARDRENQRLRMALNRTAANGERVDALRRERHELAARVTALEKEQASLRVQLSLKEQLLHQMEASASASGSSGRGVEKLRARLAASEGRRIETEGMILRAGEEAVAARCRIAELEAELVARDASIDAVKAELMSTTAAADEAVEIREQIAVARRRITELEALNTVYRKHTAKLVSELEEHRRHARGAIRSDERRRSSGTLTPLPNV